MLALLRFLVCVLGAGYVTMAAIRTYRGKSTPFWTWLNPRSADDVRKRYGDRPPY